MEIRQELCPEERYGVKCPFVRTPSRIVIHNTGNDAPAENEISYMLNRPEQVSFHYAVDEAEIIQGLPLGRNAWASGDGRGKGNMEGIHIEICRSLSGGPRFEAAERNAAELTAFLLKQYGWGLDRVTKHQDYDGKYCPHRTLDLGWGRFLELVRGFQKEEAVNYEQFREYMARYEKERAERPVSEWAQGAVELCGGQGLMAGDAGGGFRPQSWVTRQEAAQLAANLFRRLGEKNRETSREVP